jgi:RNA polymerase sigma-70 factor (ECF subfamily)
MDDRELIDKLKEGDDAAFRIVVDKYQQLVLNLSYKFLRDRILAEDITQEVFIQVFESIGSFRADAKLSTWIYRIAVTRSLNHLKYNTRKKRSGVLVRLFSPGRAEKELSLPGHERPDQEAERRERTQILSQALQKLPENQRIAFTLSKYDEMRYSEIAEVLNCSIPSVESLIHRAKTNLRKILFSYYQKNL